MQGKQSDELRTLRGLDVVHATAVFGAIDRMYESDDADHTPLGLVLLNRWYATRDDFLQDDALIGLYLNLAV